MNTKPSPIQKRSRFATSTIIAGLIALGAATTSTFAAKAPLDATELKEQATHIVSGNVIEVKSKTQKSNIETGRGIHRDKIFTIKLKVKTVTKTDRAPIGKAKDAAPDTSIKPGEEIVVVAWKPTKRVPPAPGLQGHEFIPQSGTPVTVYLKSKGDGTYRPLLPNGIEPLPKPAIIKGKPEAKETPEEKTEPNPTNKRTAEKELRKKKQAEHERLMKARLLELLDRIGEE